MPTLVVHALDDPMIPASSYHAIDWPELEASTPVRRAITRNGGHCGFHEQGADLPPTDGLLFELEGNARVIIRPSGTEPKVKAYLQAVVPVTADLRSASEQADRQIAALATAVRAWLK